jgi:hypothetical protein
LVGVRVHPSVIRPETNKCFNTPARKTARLSMLVLHDDPKREYAYGPAQGLPDTKTGTLPRHSTLRQKEKLDSDQHEERLGNGILVQIALGFGSTTAVTS